MNQLSIGIGLVAIVAVVLIASGGFDPLVIGGIAVVISGLLVVNDRNKRASTRPADTTAQGQPLLTFRGSNLAEDNEGRATVSIFPDRIVVVRGSSYSKTDQTLLFEQVAQVAIKRGPVWSTLVVESKGGGHITATGLKHQEAVDARQLIDQRLSSVQNSTGSSSDIPDQIRKLAELRDTGVLSADEFETKKRELLTRL